MLRLFNIFAPSTGQTKPKLPLGSASNMANRPANFTQADVSRAIKATVAAGLSVGRIEIDQTGRIVIIPDTAGLASSPNPCDRLLG